MSGPGSIRPRYIIHTTVIVDVVSSQIHGKNIMARVNDIEKWVVLRTQLGYRDEQLHEFVKVQQTLERERRETPKRKAERAAKEAEAQREREAREAREAEAQREREAREAERAAKEAERAAREAEAQSEREAREAERAAYMKESMKNVNYKRDWFVYKENRN